MESNDLIELDGITYPCVQVIARAIDSLSDEAPTRVVAAAGPKKRWYWQDNENPDLVWCKFILDAEGVNKNFDYMPRTQVLASFHTAKHKPMDMEHVVKEDGSLLWMDKKNPPVKNTIFGVMANSALADYKGNLLTNKQIAKVEKSDDPDRADKDKVAVVAWCAMYYFLFPQTVGSLVNYIGNGTMKVSMERWLKSWDFLVADGKNYRAVPRVKAEEMGLHTKWEQRQVFNGGPVLRRTLGFSYGGVASTTNPANSLSGFIQQSIQAEKATAALADDGTMKILRSRHDEIVERFAVSSSEADKLVLLAEHEKIHRAVAAYVGD